MPLDPPWPKLEPRPLHLDILHEDEWLIVLYKPRGLSMHPGAGRHQETTLVHALLAHSEKLSEGSEEFRPGIVHRLDKETEGIVVVAKDNKTHEGLSRQFSDRTIDRRYWALVAGRPPDTLTIEGAIARHPVHRQKMHIHTKGREAKTLVKTLKRFEEGYAWVECKLMTGRTHQIRVHLSSKGFPVLNDPLYSRVRKFNFGSPEKQRALADLEGQALMAFELGFTHPQTEKRLKFTAAKPAWLQSLTD